MDHGRGLCIMGIDYGYGISCHTENTGKVLKEQKIKQKHFLTTMTLQLDVKQSSEFSAVRKSTFLDERLETATR